MNRRNLLGLGALIPFVPFFKPKTEDKIKVGDKIKFMIAELYETKPEKIATVAGIINPKFWPLKGECWNENYPNWKNEKLYFIIPDEPKTFPYGHWVVPEQGVEKL